MYSYTHKRSGFKTVSHSALEAVVAALSSVPERNFDDSLPWLDRKVGPEAEYVI